MAYTGGHTFAKLWDWDTLDFNLVMVYLDDTDTLYASTHRSGIMQQVPGGYVPGWDTPVNIGAGATIPLGGNIHLAHVGIYPNGTAYCGFQVLNGSGQDHCEFVTNEAYGSGTWSSPTVMTLTYDGTGEPTAGMQPGTNSITPTGDLYFTHTKDSLVWNNQYLFHSKRFPYHSTTSDGTGWSWESYLEYNGLQLGHSNLPGLFRSYEQALLINNTLAGNFLSAPVRLVNGTICQMVYTDRYYKWRQCSPDHWSWNTNGGTSILTQSVQCPVPTGTMVECWLEIPSDTMDGVWVNGTLSTTDAPESVTFNIPSLRSYQIANDPTQTTCWLQYDLTVINGKDFYVSAGNPDAHAAGEVFLSTNLGGTLFGIEGSGRVNKTNGGLFSAGTGGWPIIGGIGGPAASVSLSHADVTSLVAATGSPWTIPITYHGTYDKVIVNSIRLFVADGPPNVLTGTLIGITPVILTWSEGGESVPFNMITGALGGNSWYYGNGFKALLVPVTNFDPTFGLYPYTGGHIQNDNFIADLNSLAGGSANTTLTWTTLEVDNNGHFQSGSSTFSSWHHTWDTYGVNIRYGYFDTQYDYRILRSRDNGQHWEFANDGAPIAALSDLRDYQVSYGGPPLMPLLAAMGDTLCVGWVQDGSPQLVLSSDCGESWV